MKPKRNRAGCAISTKIISMANSTIIDVASRAKPMDEKKKSNWIKKGAAQHPGLFSEKAKEAGMSTKEYAEKEKDAGGTLGKEAVFALNAMNAGKKRLRDHYKNKD